MKYWLNYLEFKTLSSIRTIEDIKDNKTLYQQELDYKQQCDKVSKLKAKQSFIRNKKKRKSKSKTNNHDR